MLSPKLTTIRQDTDKIGREAADRLISIIKKPKTALVERAVVEGILLEGESVGRIKYFFPFILKGPLIRAVFFASKMADV